MSFNAVHSDDSDEEDYGGENVELGDELDKNPDRGI